MGDWGYEAGIGGGGIDVILGYPILAQYGIAILPQYAIASTMRLDFDIALKKTNVLTLSPMFSFARNSSLLFPNNSNNYYR